MRKQLHSVIHASNFCSESTVVNSENLVACKSLLSQSNRCSSSHWICGVT